MDHILRPFMMEHVIWVGILRRPTSVLSLHVFKSISRSRTGVNYEKCIPYRLSIDEFLP